MPSIKDLYPDKWLKPEHLRGRAATVTIQGAQIEQLYNPRSRREEPKIVVEFYGKRLRLPLNKTQAFALAAINGEEDFTRWQGHQCTLSPGIAPNRQPTIQIGPVAAAPEPASAADATGDADAAGEDAGAPDTDRATDA